MTRRSRAAMRIRLAFGAASLVFAPPLWAAPCGQPDVDATFPPNAAGDVPPNAVLSAHYGAPADYAGEPVTLTDASGSELAAAADYDTAESMLRITPLTPLAAGAYQIVWPALRGLATGPGLGATTSFTAGDALDDAPPHFDGAQSVAWDLSRDPDPCSSDPEDRFIYDLTLGAVTDDRDPSLLSVVVFETRSPTHPPDLPPLELAVLPLAADGHAHVARASTRGGQVCFAAVVRDLAFNVSGGGDHEACVRTSAPPFFAGCTFAPAGPHRGVGYLLTALLVVCCQQVRRLRRARRTPRVAVLGALTTLTVLACNSPNTARHTPPSPRALPAASPFVCAAGTCTQRYPRLPDDGEWRCAELGGVALCAGGEPAAGVVHVSAPSGYRCGTRRGRPAERVCVDSSPDYPPGSSANYHCHFDSDHGPSRVCSVTTHPALAAVALPPARTPASGAPDCWLDTDCPLGCDRGYCRRSAP